MRFFVAFLLIERFVIINPFKDFFVFHSATFDGFAEAEDFGGVGGGVDAVGFEERKHNVHARARVAVGEGAGGDEAMREYGGFFFNGWINLFAGCVCLILTAYAVAECVKVGNSHAATCFL